MPAPIRAITWLIPARYFVASLKTVFLAGDIWAILLPNLLAMAVIGLLLFLLAKRATRKNLECRAMARHNGYLSITRLRAQFIKEGLSILSDRSEARSVGQEGVRTCRSRWAQEN